MTLYTSSASSARSRSVTNCSQILHLITRGRQTDSSPASDCLKPVVQHRKAAQPVWQCHAQSHNASDDSYRKACSSTIPRPGSKSCKHRMQQPRYQNLQTYTLHSLTSNAHAVQVISAVQEQAPCLGLVAQAHSWTPLGRQNQVMTGCCSSAQRDGLQCACMA
jgi:hypothetical protein